MLSKSNLLLLLLRVVITYFFILYFQDLNLRTDLEIDQYAALIGYDENLWHESALCYNDILTNLEYCYSLNAQISWPIIMYSIFKIFGFNIVSIGILKTLIYSLTLLIFSESLEKNLNTILFKFFMMLNPYIILLNISLLRDDIILSIIFLFFSIVNYSFRLKDNIKINIIKSIIITIIFTISYYTRPLIILPMLCVLLYYQYKKINIKFIIIIFISLTYILYDLVPSYTYKLNYLELFESFIRLIYSPMPWNVLNGSVVEVGSDVANVWIWSLFVFFFAVSCTINFFINIISSDEYRKYIKSNFAYLLFSFIYLLPYLFSDNAVQGPRQSLPATTFLFLVIGIPVLKELFFRKKSQVENITYY